MVHRTFLAALAAVALCAAPLAAQDTPSTKKDTTGARPAQDTTGAAKDTTGAKKDTTAAKPAADTTGVRKDSLAPQPDTAVARKDSVAVAQPVAAPAPDTTRRDTAVVTPPAAPPAADTTAVAAPAQAPPPQPPPDNAVKPGMTADEVKARWGEPLATRTVNDWTYIFYRNRRERAVGYTDVVMLQHGQVMDAIVRSPDHVYAGVSSSPEGRVPVYTPPAHQAADSSQGAAVTGVRVKPSP
jgi:hypothetical protein